jgi:hypothetical protein
MTDTDSRNWMSCLGWGCLAVVVIAALGIGGCVASVYKGGRDAHLVTEAYLDAVGAGRWEEAFATLGPGFTEDRDLAAFVAFEQAARADHVPCNEWRMSGTSFNREAGRSVALLTYQLSCVDGPVTIAFELNKLEGGWVIQDIRYNRPAGPVIQLCVECRRPIPPGASYCPFCGAPVDGGAAPETEDHPASDDGSG